MTEPQIVVLLAVVVGLIPKNSESDRHQDDKFAVLLLFWAWGDDCRET
ncbi:MAG: hypothetical protein RMY16_32370 [Nostoc sp. DedQUE12b]|nr:hypothetical protein [Nostoc sp. DedQUE12b]MDZ8090211.1 hypothetical protein [Nostoc sp. DedQUE12b]